MASPSRQTRENFRKAGEDIARYAKDLEGEVGGALFRIGEEIMTDVKDSGPNKGVPTDLGNLKNSGTVKLPDANGDVRVGFGGPAAPYALVQHERLDFSHDEGEARYLVRGVERWEPGGSAAIAALKRNAEAAARRVRST